MNRVALPPVLLGGVQSSVTSTLTPTPYLLPSTSNPPTLPCLVAVPFPASSFVQVLSFDYAPSHGDHSLWSPSSRPVYSGSSFYWRASRIPSRKGLSLHLKSYAFVVHSHLATYLPSHYAPYRLLFFIRPWWGLASARGRARGSGLAL